MMTIVMTIVMTVALCICDDHDDHDNETAVVLLSIVYCLLSIVYLHINEINESYE